MAARIDRWPSKAKLVKQIRLRGTVIGMLIIMLIIAPVKKLSIALGFAFSTPTSLAGAQGPTIPKQPPLRYQYCGNHV